MVTAQEHLTRPAHDDAGTAAFRDSDAGYWQRRRADKNWLQALAAAHPGSRTAEIARRWRQRYGVEATRPTLRASVTTSPARSTTRSSVGCSACRSKSVASVAPGPLVREVADIKIVKSQVALATCSWLRAEPLITEATAGWALRAEPDSYSTFTLQPAAMFAAGSAVVPVQRPHRARGGYLASGVGAMNACRLPTCRSG